MSRKRLKKVTMLKTVFEEESEDLVANAFGKKDENLRLNKNMTAKEKWKVGR